MKIPQLHAVAAATTAFGMILLSAAFLGGQKATVAAGDTVPDNQVKPLYEEKCSACHEAYDPNEKGYSKNEWRAVVYRMLVKHGASSSISDSQAAQIIDYLGTFAPKLLGGNRPPSEYIGIWPSEPTISKSYTFTFSGSLQSFSSAGSGWRVVAGDSPADGFLKHAGLPNAISLLEEKQTSVVGGLDLQSQFRLLESSPSTWIGLAADITDSQNMLTAQYSPALNQVSLVRYAQGQPTVIQSAVLSTPLAATVDGWHLLRLKEDSSGKFLEVWLDYSRVLKATDPQWKDGGNAGLATFGANVSGFRLMSLDVYGPPVIPAA